jgi:SAM-dependent methyltransferase
MLQLLAPRAGRAVGLDASHAMLSVARANLEEAGLARVELRQGDIYAPPFARGAFDLVVVHQVLHYLDDPARALREAARLLGPGGRLLVVDFAPMASSSCARAQAHRRLGFARTRCRLAREPGSTATSPGTRRPGRVRTAHRFPLARPGPRVVNRLAPGTVNREVA